MSNKDQEFIVYASALMTGVNILMFLFDFYPIGSTWNIETFQTIFPKLLIDLPRLTEYVSESYARSFMLLCLNGLFLTMASSFSFLLFIILSKKGTLHRNQVSEIGSDTTKPLIAQILLLAILAMFTFYMPGFYVWPTTSIAKSKDALIFLTLSSYFVMHMMILFIPNSYRMALGSRFTE
jgi:hypothetical protein